MVILPKAIEVKRLVESSSPAAPTIPLFAQLKTRKNRLQYNKTKKKSCDTTHFNQASYKSPIIVITLLYHKYFMSFIQDMSLYAFIETFLEYEI
jgi:hypothetical protein